MKRVLIFIALAILVSVSGKAQNGYKATGTVKGYDVKKINVIA